MDTGFDDWLIAELEARGWSNSELARRAGLVPSTVSMVVSGHNRPGLEFCVGVGRALSVPPERVLRRAGLLPSLPEEVEEEREVIGILRGLPFRVRMTVVAMLRGLSGQMPALPDHVNEGETPYVVTRPDDARVQELLRAFERVPDAWKDEALEAVARIERYARGKD